MNIVSYGEIINVIEHRKRVDNSDAENEPKKHFSVYELQVEYENQFQKDGESVFEWQPFTLIYQQAPKLVQEYFTLKNLSIESILNEEVEARTQFYEQKRGKKQWRGKSRNQNQERNPKQVELSAQDDAPREYIDRGFDYLAKQTLFVTDKYQLGKALNCQPTGEGKFKAKKKRLKRFLETEQAEIDKLKFPKDRNQWSSAQPTFVNALHRPGRHEQNVVHQAKLIKVNQISEEIAKPGEEAPVKPPPQEQRPTAATSHYDQPDEDGFFTIQNPGVTFEELNFTDVQQERRELEENHWQAGNQEAQLNGDPDLVNYYPKTFTKEDRKRKPANMYLGNSTFADGDKTRRPGLGDWMSELKRSKAAEPMPISKKVAKTNKSQDNVINLDTSDDELRFQSEEDIMMVDEFPQKVNKTRNMSPLILDHVEDEYNEANRANPYEHTTTTFERNRLYQGQTQEVEFDQNPWLQQRFHQKKVIESELKQASDYEKIHSYFKTQHGEGQATQESDKKKRPSEFIGSVVDNSSSQKMPAVGVLNQEQKQQVLECSKDQVQQLFKVGFRPPQPTTQGSSGETEVLMDCPQDHPGLTERSGTPWNNIPKMIHGMRVCDETGQVMYLCSWEQDYLQYFYTPSWVLSQLLINSGEDAIEKNQINNYKLVAEFFHHFAMNKALNKEKDPIPEKKPSPKKVDRSKVVTKDDWKMRIGL